MSTREMAAGRDCTYFLLLLLLAGCAQPARHAGVAKSTEDMEAKFQSLAEEFTRGYLEWRPQLATSLGFHEYDGKICDLSMASLQAEYSRLERFETNLAAIDLRKLSPQAAHDYRLLQTAIKSEFFQFEDMQVYTRNPLTYVDLIDLNIYIKRDFGPMEQRLKSIIAIEKQVPQLLAAARANLVECLAKPYIETALDVTKGAADFLERDLVEALKQVTNQALLAEFKAANQRAVAELRGFADYLTKEKLPKSHVRYALGREKYQKMLQAQECLTLEPERILQLGLGELKREQQVFAETARQIDSSRKPIEVFKAIQKDHPTEQGLISETAKDLEAIRKFLVDRKIVSLPSSVRPRVEETPRFDRATSFASMDTPGPFETRATEAYYYVTPVEPDWTPQQKEEWLTAFNYYTTDVVSIHEVYPGHYVQFLHLNASPATRLQKIFTSYAFVEGWAHYAEQMMLEEGFGANSGKSATDTVRAAKYRLAQSDEALLRLCRLCVSIKTHCDGMSIEDATRFFEENCYYEHKPATQEALRGTYDPGYLYYSLGKVALLKLREDYRKQEGTAFSLRKFHDELLGHGAPPIRLLRERMLKDKRAWEQVF